MDWGAKLKHRAGDSSSNYVVWAASFSWFFLEYFSDKLIHFQSVFCLQEDMSRLFSVYKKIYSGCFLCLQEDMYRLFSEATRRYVQTVFLCLHQDISKLFFMSTKRYVQTVLFVYGKVFPDWKVLILFSISIAILLWEVERICCCCGIS